MGGTTVVGVDGSAGGAKALRWAVEEARARGGEVEAVHAWRIDCGDLLGWRALTIAESMDWHRVRAAHQHLLEQAVRDVAGDVHLVLLKGDPREVLVEASRNARLLVIGDRGTLGSVGSFCVRHAACSVLVVR